MGNVERMAHELFHALARHGADGYHGNAKHRLELVHVY